jgi:coenzyme F420-0:L-glutamate ligase / coenzyme F420-1:gamma-L-glutamate ligase
MSDAIACAKRLELNALCPFPLVEPGDDLPELVLRSLAQVDLRLCDGDVLVFASKVISRAEGCFVDLGTLPVSERARKLAEAVALPAHLVELVLQESLEISRTGPGVLITRNRHGVVCANAGVDLSNARPSARKAGIGPWALRLPEDPDASAERLRAALGKRSGAAIGVVISDSVGRPFRLGTVAVAIGVAGIPPLFDQRGTTDLFGMTLQHTLTAPADQLATAADLVLGQAAEGRAVVHVRGLTFSSGAHSARELVRPSELDLYATLPSSFDDRR